MSSYSSKTHQASEEEAASHRRPTPTRQTVTVMSSPGSLQRTVADPAKDENKRGRDLALDQTAEVLTNFALGIGIGGGKEIIKP